MREVLNAIFYLLRTGCPWRYLPHEYPPWGTVHYYYRNWRRDGTWQQLHDTLREQLRDAAEREVSPSAAVMDSQSVPTSKKGGPEVTTKARTSRCTFRRKPFTDSAGTRSPIPLQPVR